ncbi:MAG: hypothetical protein ABI743_14680 [bacterium]
MLVCFNKGPFAKFMLLDSLIFAVVIIVTAVMLKGTPQSDPMKNLLLISWFVGYLGKYLIMQFNGKTPATESPAPLTR